MSANKDIKEDHGAGDPMNGQESDMVDPGHSGHGSASALARIRSQRDERFPGGESEEANAGGGQ